jgi:hypothetical protein
MNVLPVSVVIASLGGEQLTITVDSLINGKFIPNEIVISLPPGASINPINSNNTSIKIINSPDKGQVKQRLFGYGHCSCEIVMQSDDDVYYHHLCLQYLYKQIILLGPGNVLGPIFYDLSTGERVVKFKGGLRGFFKNLYDTFICMAPWGEKKMGAISKIGLAYGVDVSLIEDNKLYEVSWLPGGCSLSFKKDIITQDYYPFSGKAFGEDVLQSIKRSQLGQKMYIVPNCNASISTPITQNLDAKSIRSNIRAHRFVLKRINGNSLFFCAWALIYEFILNKFKKYRA